MQDKSPVSLTGHFTGQVWCENGLSPDVMGSNLGKLLYNLHRPVGWLNNHWFGSSLETMLLQRHQLIDQILFDTIKAQGTTQVLEIASGLSSRAMRTLKRFADKDICYVEADLPQMRGWKQKRLASHGFQDERHQLLPINILREEGELSPEHIVAGLRKDRPIVVITEGLVNYFPLDMMESFWRRLSVMMADFSDNLYLLDIWPRLPIYHQQKTYKWGVTAIEWFTRQQVPLHYGSDASIQKGLSGCGFNDVSVFNPDINCKGYDIPYMKGKSLFRVIRASV